VIEVVLGQHQQIVRNAVQDEVLYAFVFFVCKILKVQSFDSRNVVFKVARFSESDCLLERLFLRQGLL
jgi:hypothetical protein